MAARWVIVDDSDPGIQYEGPWVKGPGQTDGVGNFGPPFQRTSHGVFGQAGETANLSYAFNGELDLNPDFFHFYLTTSTQVPELELLEHVWHPICTHGNVLSTTSALAPNRPPTTPKTTGFFVILIPWLMDHTILHSKLRFMVLTSGSIRFNTCHPRACHWIRLLF